jgi:hypothetical protein
MGIAAMRSVDLRNTDAVREWRIKRTRGFVGVDPLPSVDRALHDAYYAYRRSLARVWLRSRTQ